MSRAANRAKTHFLKNVDLSSILEPAAPGEAAITATKVIVTIGPACQDVETLCQLLEAGASCARCDLTWGPVEFHKKSLENLQKAMHKTRKLCAIMLDTIGRELLVDSEAKLDEQGWPRHEQKLSVKTGDKITFSTKARAASNGTDKVLNVSYIQFPAMCVKGDTIFLGKYLVTGSEDSSLYLTVIEVTESEVICTANGNSEMDGLLTVFHTERSSNSLANKQNNLPILHSTDKTALEALAKDFEIDFISLSFTRHAEDIDQARNFLKSIGLDSTKVLAKCETRQALFEFQEIAQRSDGIILSRGNLGLDVLPEKMALIQKAVISNCNLLGKPVIITRVVDTMIHAPRPTRAEATDVANAVLDGCDAILLGAETLRGKQPVATVETILHICKQAERVFDHKHHFEHLMAEAAEQELKTVPSDHMLNRSPSDQNLPVTESSPGNDSQHGSDTYSRLSLGRSVSYLSKLESLASSAVRSADKVGAKLIIVYTQTGTTAGLVSKYRPPIPILTLVVPTLQCKDRLTWTLKGRSVARVCQIQRGVLPVLAAPSPSGETLLTEAVAMCVRSGIIHAHDHIVVVQKVHDAFMIKIVSVDPDGEGIASIRPQSLIDMMKNAHAAASGHLDEESSAAIEEQIKQQLAGKAATPSKETEEGTPNLVPAGNFTRHEAPVILGEPDLNSNRQESKSSPRAKKAGSGDQACKDEASPGRAKLLSGAREEDPVLGKGSSVGNVEEHNAEASEDTQIPLVRPEEPSGARISQRMPEGGRHACQHQHHLLEADTALDPLDAAASQPSKAGSAFHQCESEHGVPCRVSAETANIGVVRASTNHGAFNSVLAKDGQDLSGKETIADPLSNSEKASKKRACRIM